MDDSTRILGLTERVREEIYQHVFSNTDREVGGVLVGSHIDAGVSVRGMIPALEAVGERAAVTFTHDAWEIVHRELDRNFPDQQIVGWYHSHPGFGIFLSRDDLFIHESFFSEPWQFAYVIDPIGLEEGEFRWGEGGVVEAGRRTILPPAGFSPRAKAPSKVTARAESPQAGGDVYLRPHKREFPWGGTSACLAVGALAGFLVVAPALGIGGTDSAPRRVLRPVKTRNPTDEVVSPAATHRASETAPRSTRRRVKVLPLPAPRTTAPPPVKSYPSKAAPVEKESGEYKPEYGTGAEAPAESAPSTEAEAGGTEAPAGHFNDQ